MIATGELVAGLDDWELIGRGGFSVVYRAHQPAFERHVAVKLLECDGTDDEVRAVVDRECAAAGRLGTHPNIVTLFDRGTATDGRPYIVMEHLARGSLQARVGSAPLPAAAVADLATKLGGAVETSHRAGTLHRDIKPHNVLFSAAEEPVLVDFGLAVVFGAGSTSMVPAGFTPAFAAPELLVGHAATVATDVYSLAATLYFAATGHAPIPPGDESYVTFVGRVLRTRPAPPTGLPRRGRDALMASLAVQPPERPTVAELVDALTSDGSRSMVLLDDITIDPDRVLPRPSSIEGLAIAATTPPPRISSRIALGIGAVAVLALGIGLGVWRGADRDVDAATGTTTSAPAATTEPRSESERLAAMIAEFDPGSSYFERTGSAPAGVQDDSARLTLALAGIPDVATAQLGVTPIPIGLPSHEQVESPARGRTWAVNKRDVPACHGFRSREFTMVGIGQGVWQADDVSIAAYLWEFRDGADGGPTAEQQVADAFAAGALQLGAAAEECTGFGNEGLALDGGATIAYDDLASVTPTVPSEEVVIRSDTNVPIGPAGGFTFRYAHRMMAPLGDRLLRLDLYTTSPTPPSPTTVKAFLIAARDQVAGT